MNVRTTLSTALLASTTLVFACGRNEPTDVVKSGTVSLHLAESADASGVIITVLRVENDSRCATDVTCVWAGNATVVITARTPGGPPATLAQLFVNTNIEPRSVDVGDYRIRLDSLTPSPLSTHAIAQQDYVAYLTVTHK